uniref:Integrase zinc-binding domain-containing protein n=1 Tax=Ditylenchus dipsaci TaxID=166011 RepID=A0A915ENL7_9BILA
MAELENIKTFYLQHITNLYHKKTNNSVLMTRQDYQAKLERLLVLENSMVTKTSSDYRILKVCDILITDSDGTQIPKLCRRGTNLLFVYIEELFEIVHNAHLLLKHAGRNCLQRYFQYCNITKDCIMSYLITCKNCPRKKRIIIRSAGQKRPNKSDEEDECDDHNEQFFQPLTGNPHQSSSSREPSTNQVAENSNSGVARVVSTTPLHIPLFKAHRGEQRQDESFTRGQVDVFNMQKEPDGEFNWILRYINLTTHEVRLRPLRSGTAHETADLLSLNGRNFAEEVIREVVKIWPQCRQLHSYMKKVMSSNESSENLLINQLSN